MPINLESMDLDELAQALKNALLDKSKDFDIYCENLWYRVQKYVMYFAERARNWYGLKDTQSCIAYTLFDDCVIYKLRYYNKSIGHFSGFLEKYLHRLLYDEYLNKKDIKKSDVLVDRATEEMDMDNEFLKDLVRDSVSELKNKNQRKALANYLEGRKVKEIAKITGRKEGTVKSDISRAKKSLEKILKEKGVMLS